MTTGAHQCDSTDTARMVRVQRLLLSWLPATSPDLAEFERVMREFGNCSWCLSRALTAMMGIAAASLTDQHGGDVRMAVEMSLAATESGAQSG
ncbi:hypothetical protein ACNQR7_26950 [Mycolicibacterium senegalense]|uniref:hypothetical protein n=1 Tax=Mycolicibacterium TaxID=1866885 RepID=UPI003204F24C